MIHFVDDKTHELLLKIDIFYSDIDNVIDALRIKYNVIIYNTAAPFVDKNSNGKIVYNFSVKKCNPHFGWNGRELIETSNVWDANIYDAKRRAIRAAARWILAHKCKKISIKLRKKKNGTSKKRS
jgi:hypothetical protein